MSIVMKRGNDAVEEDLGCEHVGCGCAAVTRKLNSVATDGETYLMWVVFFWSKMCTYATVGDVSALINRDVMFRDEHDGVCALDGTGNAWCQSAKFLSICFPPGGAIIGVLDEVPVFLALRKSVGNSLDAAR